MGRVIRDGRVFVVSGMNYRLWCEHMHRVLRGRRSRPALVRHLVCHGVYMRVVRSGRTSKVDRSG